MSIAEITIKINARYLPVLVETLKKENIDFQTYTNNYHLSNVVVDVKINYTSNLMNVLKEFFDGLEIQISLDNTL